MLSQSYAPCCIWKYNMDAVIKLHVKQIILVKAQCVCPYKAHKVDLAQRLDPHLFRVSCKWGNWHHFGHERPNKRETNFLPLCSLLFEAESLRLTIVTFGKTLFKVVSTAASLLLMKLKELHCSYVHLMRQLHFSVHYEIWMFLDNCCFLVDICCIYTP